MLSNGLMSSVFYGVLYAPAVTPGSPEAWGGPNTQLSFNSTNKRRYCNKKQSGAPNLEDKTVQVELDV